VTCASCTGTAFERPVQAKRSTAPTACTLGACPCSNTDTLPLWASLRYIPAGALKWFTTTSKSPSLSKSPKARPWLTPSKSKPQAALESSITGRRSMPDAPRFRKARKGTDNLGKR
jgi:hypothetical protein